ncbi:hypothetical protein [Pelagerythrobacter sp.]|uniref:hypothetical protein n=1 Tax=Pelagerythrobacter sp. TaxID=2800702 RepID=UPI0035AE4C6F
MRILALSAAAVLALPAAASAQPAGDYYDYDGYEDAEPQYEAPLSQRLADPAAQEQMAATIAVLGEVLLDLPLAPFVAPLAEATGAAPGSVDPDLTLRSMNPQAGDIPAEAARELPRAMGAMAAMAGSIEAMRPALGEMAERLRAGIEEAQRRTP